MSTGLRLVNIHSDEFWNAKKAQLDAIANPRDKFQAFDKITDEILLESTSFFMLTATASDPRYKETLKMPRPFWVLTERIVDSSLSLINRCKQLSEHVMKDVGSRAVSDLCGHPTTYIYTKMARVMSRIFLSENYMFTSNPTHGLKPLHDQTWDLLEYNHANLCSCNKHLSERFG